MRGVRVGPYEIAEQHRAQTIPEVEPDRLPKAGSTDREPHAGMSRISALAWEPERDAGGLLKPELAGLAPRRVP